MTCLIVTQHEHNSNDTGFVPRRLNWPGRYAGAAAGCAQELAAVHITLP